LNQNWVWVLDLVFELKLELQPFKDQPKTKFMVLYMCGTRIKIENEILEQKD
jgi:hypothetical protein